MKTIDLEFEEYPGDVYTVTVSPVPLAMFEKLGGLFRDAAKAFVESGDTTLIREMATEFVKVAQPKVKGKAAKLLDLDANLILALAQRWHAGVRSVPLPLLRGSSSTATSPER